MKKFLMAAAVAALGVTSAQAADLAARPVYTKAPMMAAPVYDWTGFYLGGEVGGSWSTTSLARVAPVGTLAYSARIDQAAAGGFIGVQKQFGQFVLGVEGNYVTGFGHADFAVPAVDIFVPGGTGVLTVKGLRDTWTVGARGGYAINNWLPYVTGGYANSKFGYSAISTSLNTLSESADARLSGYYIGGGLDYGVTQNWIVGAEYRHYDFQDKSVANTISNGTVTTVNVDGKADTFMGRLSYKFNWASPVVAKY